MPVADSRQPQSINSIACSQAAMGANDFFEQNKDRYETLINSKPEYKAVVEAFVRHGASWGRLECSIIDDKKEVKHITPECLEEVEDMCDMLQAWPVMVGDHITFYPIPPKPLEDSAREHLAETYLAICRERNKTLSAPQHS